jgi:hypothetical protein
MRKFVCAAVLALACQAQEQMRPGQEPAQPAVEAERDVSERRWRQPPNEAAPMSLGERIELQLRVTCLEQFALCDSARLVESSKGWTLIVDVDWPLGRTEPENKAMMLARAQTFLDIADREWLTMIEIESSDFESNRASKTRISLKGRHGQAEPALVKRAARIAWVDVTSLPYPDFSSVPVSEPWSTP